MSCEVGSLGDIAYSPLKLLELLIHKIFSGSVFFFFPLT